MAGLGTDQEQAVRFLLETSDRIAALRGLAGTGKSTLLKELARALQQAGIPVQFCAPTASASEVLRKDGLEAVTVARLHQLPELPGGVTVVDEAGAVGLEDMQRLLGRSGRVVLCGDTGQHAPVPRGDALRILEEHASLATIELGTIRRQRMPRYRAAVLKAAHKDPQSAFELLERMGAVASLGTRDVHREAARLYVESRARNATALVVAPTWAEIDKVTGEVRDRLKASRTLVGEERAIEVHRSLGWTRAQAADPRGVPAGSAASVSSCPRRVQAE